jgi:hypothetical protein
MDILFDEIPSLDLAEFTAGTPAQKTGFVQKLGVLGQRIKWSLHVILHLSVMSESL